MVSKRLRLSFCLALATFPLLGCISSTLNPSVSIEVLGYLNAPGKYWISPRPDLCISDLLELAGGVQRGDEEHHSAMFVKAGGTVGHRKIVFASQDKWNTPIGKLGVDIRIYNQLEIRRRLPW
jgi:hypothetical protein